MDTSSECECVCVCNIWWHIPTLNQLEWRDISKAEKRHGKKAASTCQSKLNTCTIHIIPDVLYYTHTHKYTCIWICIVCACAFYRNDATLQRRQNCIPHIILTCVANFPAFSFAQYSQKLLGKDEKLGLEELTFLICLHSPRDTCKLSAAAWV